MTYTDVVINTPTQEYGVFRLFTEYTVDEVDYKRLVQYFVHRDDVDIEFIQDSETPNIKSLRVYDDERVLLFDMQTDADSVNSNDSALDTDIDASRWEVSGVLVTPTTDISDIYTALYNWKFNIEI
jgi:hypothetical protein